MLMSKQRLKQEEATIKEKMLTLSKEQQKKRKFIKTKMWFSTIISMFYKDRGKIPDNIGNNILIGNNIVVTKNYITGIILVKELSERMPIAFISRCTKYVKNAVKEVEVSWVFKNETYYTDPYSSGMKSRERSWQRTLDNPIAYYKSKKRAARLLYSLDVARSGERLYKCRIFCYVRAKTGTDLTLALNKVKEYMEQHGTQVQIVSSDIATYLDYISLISSKYSGKIKDVACNIVTSTTIAEMCSDITGFNDTKGWFLGINRKNRAPYFLNIFGSANGKNIFVAALSGAGKTFLIQDWLFDAYAIGCNLCIQDIKGTEYAGLTEACGGSTLSMKSNSTRFVNTFVLRMPEDMDYMVYCNEMFQLSAQQLMIMSNLDPLLEPIGRALVEEFLRALYAKYGVLFNNPNTYLRSSRLHPYVVFDEFELYMSEAMKRKYDKVSNRMLTRIAMFISRKGSQSHMYRDEYSFEEIKNSKIIRFDFGMLDSSGIQDETMFKLRYLFMKLIKNDFIRYKKKLGEWTINVMEEQQIAADYVIRSYSEDITLRRAQNVVNILIGNSVKNLITDKNAKGILDNMNILCFGQLIKSTRSLLIEEYGLEKFENDLYDIANNPDYDRTFLLVNRMTKNAVPALLKAFVPDRVANGSVFRVVDTIDENS